MKKKVCITIEEDVWNFMEKNFTNKAGLIQALITKYYMEKNINIKPQEEELPELKEVFGNEGTTQTNS